jgi:hypothetical protein
VSRRTKATLIWGLTPYICVMVAGVIWESMSAHHFDPGFLREWRFQVFLVVFGFIVALLGTTLQWLIPVRLSILAIAFGFLFSLAFVAAIAWMMIRFFGGSGAVILYYLAALAFAPPADLGGVISGIIRARDHSRATAATGTL